MKETRRLYVVPRHTSIARIGSPKGLSLHTCTDTLRAPFEERVTAFLDLLYSDETRAGVTSVRHAQALFRTWLGILVVYEPVEPGLLPFLSALLPFYPKDRGRDGQYDLLPRNIAEAAIREPFERVLSAYVERVFDPAHNPGVRDRAHARDTFVTFCHLLKAFEEAR